MIRVLYVLNEFMYGSKVRQLCDLVSGLDKERFQPEICSFDLGDEASSEVEKLKVPMFRLRLVPEKILNPKIIAQFLISPITLMTKRYDIIHSLCYQSIATEPLIAKIFSRAKFIYTKTNLEWENHAFNWMLKSKLADQIISISGATDRQLLDHGFGGKMTTIYNGTDTDRFTVDLAKGAAVRDSLSIPDTAMVFGCAAHFIEVKEQDNLIRAFDKLAKKHHDIHLVMCGGNHADGYFDRVMELYNNSSFKNRIHMMGTVEDMPAFYSSIDCFVLPSRFESFGYVYIEAMSCQKPVIAPRTGGPLDIVVDGETGLLTNPSDVEDLATHMDYYIGSPSTRLEHGKAGSLRARKLFSREVMISKHESLYESLPRS